MTSPVFSLPRYRMGPYDMQVMPGSRASFPDRRRSQSNDWTNGVVHLDEALSPRRVLECFVLHLVTAIHYRSGLNDKSDEESYTHSLATGLVELARNNVAFWAQLNAALQAEYAPDQSWAAFAGSVRGAPPPMPTSLRYGARRCELRFVPAAQCDRMNVYGLYFLKQGKIELSEGLHGVNLALVCLHEVFHFTHECERLTDRTKEAPFKRTQAKMLVRLIRQNPTFWAWWLALVHPRRRAAA